MAATISSADVAVGQELPSLKVQLQRVNLVMYAGASGDFNPIHWNERIAKAVGLPDVIAHGMLTMAQAGRVVTDWIGDPGAIVSFRVRFSKPVVIHDDDVGATVRVGGKVVELDEGGRATVELTATTDNAGIGDVEVLKQAVAVVQLS